MEKNLEELYKHPLFLGQEKGKRENQLLTPSLRNHIENLENLKKNSAQTLIKLQTHLQRCCKI